MMKSSFLSLSPSFCKFYIINSAMGSLSIHRIDISIPLDKHHLKRNPKESCKYSIHLNVQKIGYSIQTSKKSKVGCSESPTKQFQKVLDHQATRAPNIFIAQNVTIYMPQFEKMPMLSCPTHENIKMMIKLSTAENRNLLILLEYADLIGRCSSKIPLMLHRERKQSKAKTICFYF